MRGKIGKTMQMARQAKQLRSKVKKVEKELKKTLVTKESADGTVKVTLDAKLNFRSIQIDPELVESKDTKKLEKNISESFKEALSEAQSISETRMATLSKDLNIQIPGMEM